MAKKSSKGHRSTGKPPASREEASSSVRDDGEKIRSIERLHIWQIQAVRDLLVIAAVIGVIWVGHALRAVTVPLLVALMLAYLFEPLVQRVTRSGRVSRSGAVAALLAALGILVLLLGLGLLPVVVGQTGQFVNSVRDGSLHSRVDAVREWVPEAYGTYFDAAMDRWGGDEGESPAEQTDLVSDDGAGLTGALTGALAEKAEKLDAEGGVTPPAPAPASTPESSEQNAGADAAESLDERINRLIETRLAERADSASGGGETDWLGIARGTLATTVRLVGSIVSLGLLLFLIPFYFFFFSVWYPDVVAFGREMIPKKNHCRTVELLTQMDLVVAGFVRGRIVISAIMSVMLSIGWQLCSVPYAVPLGLLIGVFCAVPYLGGIGIPLACGLSLLSWMEMDPRGPLWAVFAWPILVFVVVQLIEGYVLVPLIAGKATNLDPVTILVAVLAGGSVLGIYGMLLAIPAVACAKILFLEVLLPQIRAWVRGEIADPIPIGRD